MIAMAEESPEYKNIEIDGKGNLVLTPEQYIKLADYIEELKAENLKLKSQLEQALKEIDIAYEQKNTFDLTGLSSIITGAGLAALIILISQNI
jgi:predicted ATPase